MKHLSIPLALSITCIDFCRQQDCDFQESKLYKYQNMQNHARHQRYMVEVLFNSSKQVGRSLPNVVANIIDGRYKWV